MGNIRQTASPSTPVNHALLDRDSLLNWTVSPGHEAAETSMDEFVFGWSLVQMYGESYTAAGKHAVPARTLPERLATLLVALGEPQQGIPTVRDRSSADLATSLDCSREAIASLLRTFRRQRMIDIRHDAIILIDMEMLAEISGLSG